MPNGIEFLVSFDEVSGAEAGLFAQDLRARIREAHPDLSAERRRADPAAMDLGTVLQVASTGADAIAFAQLGMAIIAWLHRQPKGKLTISTSKGKVVAEGLTARDQARLMQVLAQISE